MKQIKMKNDKKLFMLIELVLAVVVVVLAFLMLQGRAGKAPEKVSVILQDSDDSQWAAFLYGLKMAARDYGVELSIVTTGEFLTEEEQAAIMEDEIDKGADALIVQPVSGEETKRTLSRIRKKLPVMLVGNANALDGAESEIPGAGADDYEMGRALAVELLRDCEGNVEGRTIGIYTKQESESDAVRRRREGFEDALKGRGAELIFPYSNVNLAQLRRQADFVVALDDSSLNALGTAAAHGHLYGAQVYGVGHSTEAVALLDAGYVERLVVPDEFSVGYRSLTEVAGQLQYPHHPMENVTVSYTVMSEENLFTEENQEILYTMSQ